MRHKTKEGRPLCPTTEETEMAKETALGLLCEKLSSLFPGAIVDFEKGGELVVRMGVTADESGDLIPFKSSLRAPTTAKDIKRAWGGRRALRRT